MSSNRDFAVEQIFRADEFRADDPSPKKCCKAFCQSQIVRQLLGPQDNKLKRPETRVSCIMLNRTVSTATLSFNNFERNEQN